MLLQEAYKRFDSANKRFCSVPLTSCTPHVTSIPSFPPSIFQNHSPAACISLCLLCSRPSSSIRQMTRFQRPCNILHPSSCYHPLFPDLQLPVSLTLHHQLARALETIVHYKTHQTQFVLPPILLQQSTQLTKLCCSHSCSTTSMHNLAP